MLQPDILGWRREINSLTQWEVRVGANIEIALGCPPAGVDSSLLTCALSGWLQVVAFRGDDCHFLFCCFCDREKNLVFPLCGSSVG